MPEPRPDLAHIGWWSDANGFTPSRGPDGCVVSFMRSRGDQPVYVKPSEAVMSSGPSEPHLSTYEDFDVRMNDKESVAARFDKVTDIIDAHWPSDDVFRLPAPRDGVVVVEIPLAMLEQIVSAATEKRDA